MAAVVSGGRSARARVSAWIQRSFDPRRHILTDSGTSALALAMQAATLRSPGKPILLPAYSCYDLVTAAMAARVNVRWYDITPETLQPDWASLRSGLSDGAAGVVVVHHYGIPMDMGQLRGLAGEAKGLLVIEDAAQAVGGELENRPLGALGDLGVLSFGRGKGMTGGGGGALLGNTREAAELLDRATAGLRAGNRGWSSLVSTKAQWILARPSLYALPASIPFLQLGATVFRPPHEPSGIGAAQAGTLGGTIRLQSEEIRIRQWNALRLRESAGSLAIPVTGQGAHAGYLRLPILLPRELAGERDSPEARRLGIMPGYPVPLPALPGSPLPTAPAPGASILATQLVTLPVHSLLSEVDLKRIERVVDEWRSIPRKNPHRE